ncbi:hypothetical protein BY454_10730 [Marinobacter persicus]|uniref:Uncharacterized protein n=1 Tax=Marinobacter persicus TaxID=930118 RepID=A0A2S6G3Z6_9GAMM|nr:hypothetical protein BY455_10930 [Marinobacter persicus]PPK53802.1 hypothetical protein B0H24_102430 [Marinobacter persicus]PPK58710.1 hypothetical protein BY454_10730 [Marinobacter persicus]
MPMIIDIGQISGYCRPAFCPSSFPFVDDCCGGVAALCKNPSVVQHYFPASADSVTKYYI